MSNKPGRPNIRSSHHTHGMVLVLDLPYWWLSELLLWHARNGAPLWFSGLLHIRREVKLFPFLLLTSGGMIVTRSREAF
jgi:hypothetical protein